MGPGRVGPDFFFLEFNFFFEFFDSCLFNFCNYLLRALLSFANLFLQPFTVNSLSPFSLVIWEGRGKPKIVTNDDMGGRGAEKSEFCGEVIFARPHRRVSMFLLVPKKLEGKAFFT